MVGRGFNFCFDGWVPVLVLARSFFAGYLIITGYLTFYYSLAATCQFGINMVGIEHPQYMG